MIRFIVCRHIHAIVLCISIFGQIKSILHAYVLMCLFQGFIGRVLQLFDYRILNINWIVELVRPFLFHQALNLIHQIICLFEALLHLFLSLFYLKLWSSCKHVLALCEVANGKIWNDCRVESFIKFIVEYRIETVDLKVFGWCLFDRSARSFIRFDLGLQLLDLSLFRCYSTYQNLYFFITFIQLVLKFHFNPMNFLFTFALTIRNISNYMLIFNDCGFR